MKLTDILNEETTRLNDYYVPEYFKSRAPYSKREIGNNIYNIHDKDGILVAVFNKNNITPQPSRGWRDNYEIIKWGFDWRSKLSDVNPPIMISSDFISPLLNISGVSNPEAKRGFNWYVYSNTLNYFGIQRKEKTPEGEDIFIQPNFIAITSEIKGGPYKPDVIKKEKGQSAAMKTIVGRKKQIIREKIKENTQEIKLRLGEIKKLTQQIELLKKQMSEL